MSDAGRSRRRQQRGRNNNPVVVDPTSITRKQTHNAELGLKTAILLFAFALLLAALCGLLYWQQQSPPPPPSQQQQQQPDQPSSDQQRIAQSSVYERALVTTNATWDSIVAEHGRPWRDAGHRHFRNSVLAYVTPWNSLGYDMAKKFRAKFTHVSPVWYQLKRGDAGLELFGKHDVDRNWINDVRQDGSPMIVPRVVLEGYPVDMLVDAAERQRAIDLIAKECKDMDYDGIVLEAWTSWAFFSVLDKRNLRQKALEFVRVLGTTLHGMKASSHGNMQLHFVIPPPTDPTKDARSFSRADMAILGNTIDGLSVMTYDFSGPGRPGPNAPASWIRSTLQTLGANETGAPEVLLGLNFYGNDYTLPLGGGPIVGHQYISVLEKYKPKTIMWEKGFEEHYFLYDGEDTKHVVFYPTLASISARLNTANNVGSGISIWEIGQGLEYFFDLL